MTDLGKRFRQVFDPDLAELRVQVVAEVQVDDSPEEIAAHYRKLISRTEWSPWVDFGGGTLLVYACRTAPWVFLFVAPGSASDIAGDTPGFNGVVLFLVEAR